MSNQEKTTHKKVEKFTIFSTAPTLFLALRSRIRQKWPNPSFFLSDDRIPLEFLCMFWPICGLPRGFLHCLAWRSDRNGSILPYLRLEAMGGSGSIHDTGKLHVICTHAKSQGKRLQYRYRNTRAHLRHHEKAEVKLFQEINIFKNSHAY